jgi:hypothetical protein
MSATASRLLITRTTISYIVVAGRAKMSEHLQSPWEEQGWRIVRGGEIRKLREGRLFARAYNGIFLEPDRTSLLYVDPKTSFEVTKDRVLRLSSASLPIHNFGLAIWRMPRVQQLIRWANAHAISLEMQREGDSNIHRCLIRIEDYVGYLADHPPTQSESDRLTKDLTRVKWNLRRLMNKSRSGSSAYVLIDELRDRARPPS